MLVIRAEQMKVFEQAARQRFEDDMAVHSRKFSPRLCEVIGDEQLHVALRSAIGRAEGYGFTNRGPIRLYIEMAFLYGSAFDDDPQYPAVGGNLRGFGDQMERAERIHQWQIDYYNRVSGPDAGNVRGAIQSLPISASAPIAETDDFAASMLGTLDSVCPQKAAYTGEAGLRALIGEGMAEARNYGFDTVAQTALLVILKFGFGHGCARDPLYPWISRALQDEKIVTPEARAARLEKKAITWLDHVISGDGRGSRT